MKLAHTPDADFLKVLNHICILCGYPALSPDKSSVVISFLRNTHATATTEDLSDAFNQLAAGRLDEKMDGFKSVTGLSCSRVLQAYLRQRQATTTRSEQVSGVISEENREIILAYNGRAVYHNADLTGDERDYLNNYWIEKQRENYIRTRRMECISITAFDFLERTGRLRIENGQLQKLHGQTYVTIAQWETVEDMGMRYKQSEDAMMRDPDRICLGTLRSVSEAVKKTAVSIYFEK
jgi:hypothetical protein